MATTTVFAHFPCKQALAFEQAEPFKRRLRQAVLNAGDDDDLLAVVHGQVSALIEHCTTGAAVDTWRMIEDNDDLSTYAHQLESEFAGVLQSALQETGRMGVPAESIELFSRFCMAAFPVARKAPQPQLQLRQAFGIPCQRDLRTSTTDIPSETH